MAYADDGELTSDTSLLHFYGEDLKRRREEAGLKQTKFAAEALIAPSLLSKIESGKRLPSKELSVLADARFGTGDHFQRLWPLVIKYAYPSWFRPFVELEATARAIRSFQVQVVPGLLQTQEYARAVLEAGRLDPDRVEELLAARVVRQDILTRENPPELWVVLDETVLRRPMGSSEVFAGQLQRLLEATESARTVLQVIPFSAGGHAGNNGAFSALAMDEGPDVVYVDGLLQGQIHADPAEVRAATRIYTLLQAGALSPAASLDLIRTVMKDHR
ncbi:Helix-turn-helix [Actinacidiphila alni]|uniref:Helix-turn-helix n=1 Tax=Actinacidiphila alni TaxID=380248 RepID=A0A1I2J441_9ACTN|nr:helix-turn-helix transcriptional regulator [Actinacidiphila alni]SFF49512.1 Helix-turn-helix [Actinacidiphila alni]